MSVLRPLYDSGQDDEATRNEALRRLAALDYGDDGYFFVYDLQGSPDAFAPARAGGAEPLGAARLARPPTIQELIARARDGGGFVEYLWRKPSSAQMAPKLGYVTALPRWNWMVGTGLYLDDIEATLDTLDRQVSATCTDHDAVDRRHRHAVLGAVSAAGLLLNLSEHRVADAKLRCSRASVVQSQEDERGRLARELHDGTSQTLVSTKLLIESAVDSLERARRGRRRRRSARRWSGSMIRCRSAAHLRIGLRPALLDTLGLAAALEHLGRNSARSGA